MRFFDIQHCFTPHIVQFTTTNFAQIAPQQRKGDKIAIYKACAVRGGGSTPWYAKKRKGN